MNSDPNFLNPLNNPIFEIVLFKTLIVYLLGFILIFILNHFSFKGLLKKNIGKRYLSWLLMGPLYLLFIFLGGIPALAFLVFILLLAIHEIDKASKMPKIYIFSLYFLSLVSVYVVGFQTEYFYSLPLFYFLIVTFAAIRENNAEKSFINASVSLFVSIWIIFSLSHFVLLGHLNNTLDASKSLLILLGFAIPLSDVMAYVVGRSFAKVKFLDKFKVASNLSSKKSYVGSLGNILGAGLGVLLMFSLIGDYINPIHWIFITILLGVGGLIGDITASMFKRFYKIKDSGQLIPGHGGVLDRIDSTLRAIVILYYYLLFVI